MVPIDPGEMRERGQDLWALDLINISYLHPVASPKTAMQAEVADGRLRALDRAKASYLPERGSIP